MINISRPEKVGSASSLQVKRKMHPNSLANLHPYKPGRNGHGRVYPLKERLYHALDKPLLKPKDNAPAGDHLVYATLRGATELVPVAFRETWDRIEGKVPDKIAILGKVVFEIVHVEKRKDYIEEFTEVKE